MYEENIPVLIVGGGPVGLSAALFLARLGVRSLLVERHSGTSIHPRARGINYRSVEILRSVGLEEAVRQAGAALANNRISLLVNTLNEKEIRRIGGLEESAADRERLAKITPAVWCLCAQDELEPLLLAAVREHGAQVRFGTELVSFEQTTSGIIAQIVERETGIERTVQASYMIAADGTGSFTRNQLGINMVGRGTIGYYMGIYFRADLSELVKDREFVMCFVKNPEAPGTIASVNNHDRWVFNVEYNPADGATAADFTPARCVELVRKAIGLPELEVELLSILRWEAAVQVAEHYQDNRVFLAGDAVHVMPPAGAFGLNTGVQDVHNLAWKLAAVLKGQAGSALLNTYEVERQPVGYFTAEQAGLRLDFRGGRGPAKPDSENKGPTLIDDMVMMLGYQYTSAAIIGGRNEGEPLFPDKLTLNGQPGSRAPHIWLEGDSRDGKPISTLDLFDKNFVLLSGENGAAWCEAAHRVGTNRKITIEAYRIGNNADFKDPNEDWASTYGVGAKEAVLVRPDGFVAWRSTESEELAEQKLEQALNQLLIIRN